MIRTKTRQLIWRHTHNLNWIKKARTIKVVISMITNGSIWEPHHQVFVELHQLNFSWLALSSSISNMEDIFSLPSKWFGSILLSDGYHLRLVQRSIFAIETSGFNCLSAAMITPSALHVLQLSSGCRHSDMHHLFPTRTNTHFFTFDEGFFCAM